MQVVQLIIKKNVSLSKFIFLILYVNNILLTRNNLSLLYETNDFLSNKFKIKDMSKPSFLVGIKIFQDRK